MLRTQYLLHLHRNGNLNRNLFNLVRFCGSSCSHHQTGNQSSNSSWRRPLLHQSLNACRQTGPKAFLFGLQTKVHQFSTTAKAMKRRSEFFKPGFSQQRKDEVDVVLPPTIYLLSLAFISAFLFFSLAQF